MTTWERKICLLGAAGVGKTSLVRRYIEGIFSDAYLSTIGVTIARRTVTLGEDTINLMVWDIEGETDRRSLRMRYLRGAAGYLVVADGTRPETLDAALAVQAQVADRRPGLPFALLLNKHDLSDRWALPADRVAALADRWPVLTTSARTGDSVGAAFDGLARRLLPPIE
ncbi:MAG: Rab family GTPase [Gemmatimonadales bacterium]|nr:Rab family GTPase [Gemmatimonadales bacterium]